MNFMMVMDYKVFLKYQALAILSGAVMVGSWWLASKWERDYKEAQKAGAVA